MNPLCDKHTQRSCAIHSSLIEHTRVRAIRNAHTRRTICLDEYPVSVYISSAGTYYFAMTEHNKYTFAGEQMIFSAPELWVFRTKKKKNDYIRNWAKQNDMREFTSDSLLHNNLYTSATL